MSPSDAGASGVSQGQKPRVETQGKTDPYIFNITDVSCFSELFNIKTSLGRFREPKAACVLAYVEDRPNTNAAIP
jgi:hypothetical protein